MTEQEKTDKLIEFLKTVPDDLLLSEAARRNRAKRIDNKGNPAKLKQCDFCDEFHGVRAMRLHVAQAHPGGKKKWPMVHQKKEVPRPCKHCSQPFGYRALRDHIKAGCPAKTKREAAHAPLSH